MGLIGKFLSTLNNEQESRVLTTAMKPGSYEAPCLVGVAGGGHNIACGQISERFAVLNGKPLANVKAKIASLAWDTVLILAATDSVEMRFDYLCQRLGNDTAGVLIRNRILRNRLRRTLAEGDTTIAMQQHRDGAATVGAL